MFHASQVDELTSKYQTVSVEEVAEGWKEVYERSLTSCMHGASCQTGPSCQVSATSHIQLAIIHKCFRIHTSCAVWV